MILAPYKTSVVSAAEARLLTSLEAVKSDLEMTGTANDQSLLEKIATASDMICTYCDRQFAKDTVTDLFRIARSQDQNLVDELRLTRRPVTSVTSVVEGETTLVSADYELDLTIGTVWRLDGDDNRRSWANNVKVSVTYVAGYELLDGLPRDVEQAALLLTKQLWFQRKTNPLVRQSSVPGVLDQTLWVGAMPGQTSLPPDVSRLLEPHRDSY